MSLLDGIVPAPAAVVGTGLQNGEFEIEVRVQGQEDGEGREEDVGDEGGYYGGEGVGEAGFVCKEMVSLDSTFLSPFVFGSGLIRNSLSSLSFFFFFVFVVALVLLLFSPDETSQLLYFVSSSQRIGG